MSKETKQAQDESLSPEVQDVMRNLITAIRTTKIYPPNNPIYSQSIKKSFEGLAQFLESSREYHVGVQKNHFTYMHTPIGGRDVQLNKALAQDLFAKGIREIVFSSGVTETELLEFCQALALSLEELAMKSGISTILWEKGTTHIKVTESGLDDVVTTKTEGGRAGKDSAEAVVKDRDKAIPQKQTMFVGRTLVLGDVMTDPAGFASSMLALARKTRTEHESIEDRLFRLYQQAGNKIRTEHAGESDALFDGLAKSVLSLETPHREALIAGKLYGDLDAEIAIEQESENDPQLPSALHEIQTGRFSSDWNAQQIATLLKRTAAKKIVPPAPPPSPADLVVAPIPQDLSATAKELAEYSPEQMEVLKILGGSGMESDIIDAAVRTLISLLPLARNPLNTVPTEREIGLFSGVVHQLEDMLSYLLKKNNYDLATAIIKALHKPVGPEFKPRMAEALKKTATKAVVISTIGDMRKHSKESPEYQSAYAYLSILEQKATEALLELVAEEEDREARMFLLDLMKDFGKNQIALLGENLSDKRWYVVRNIVCILGESKTDQAIALLRKAADHQDARIRQEVIKALISTGGKKAAGVLAKFLRDQDAAIQLMAIGAYAELPGVGAEESKPLIDFLEERSLKKKDQELTLAAIKTLGKVGGRDAAAFLEVYNRIRWWRSRQLQVERREAALGSIQEIKGRRGNGGRGQR